MDLFGDLKDSRWMYLKAALFLVLGCIASATLLWENPTLRTAFLLVLVIWSFCRLYYFLFYVLEKYIDPGFRFDGIAPALLYLWRKRSHKRNDSQSS